eukprot:9238477-Pyramimonas_sp.AAC.1
MSGRLTSSSSAPRAGVRARWARAQHCPPTLARDRILELRPPAATSTPYPTARERGHQYAPPLLPMLLHRSPGH